MHSFGYQNGSLHCEATDLQALASEHGTPLFVYSKKTILDNYQRLASAMSELDCQICFATKANSNIAVLNQLAKAGAGFDVVSSGEIFRVEKAGGDPGNALSLALPKPVPKSNTASRRVSIPSTRKVKQNLF